MNVFQIAIFIIALLNLIAISVLIYFKESKWALALAILEIVIVAMSLSS